MNHRHPGTIEFVDGSRNKVLKRTKIAGLPRHRCWVDTANGPVPIVRVIAFTAGGKRSIVEYGPDGEILRTTVQVLIGVS